MVTHEGACAIRDSRWDTLHLNRVYHFTYRYPSPISHRTGRIDWRIGRTIPFIVRDPRIIEVKGYLFHADTGSSPCLSYADDRLRRKLEDCVFDRLCRLAKYRRYFPRYYFNTASRCCFKFLYCQRSRINSCTAKWFKTCYEYSQHTQSPLVQRSFQVVPNPPNAHKLPSLLSVVV